MATIDGYKLDTTPGCGGWVAELNGRIFWPPAEADGSMPMKSQQEAESAASAIPGATAVRVDLVLRKTPNAAGEPRR